MYSTTNSYLNPYFFFLFFSFTFPSSFFLFVPEIKAITSLILSNHSSTELSAYLFLISVFFFFNLKPDHTKLVTQTGFESFLLSVLRNGLTKLTIPGLSTFCSPERLGAFNTTAQCPE